AGISCLGLRCLGLLIDQLGVDFGKLLLANQRTGSGLDKPMLAAEFLPTVARYRVPHSSELIASRGMDQLLQTARQSFDYIIVDLP
ncbi:hypothetical protein ACC697_38875, partial [Rhizobium ruizarguesonis]